MIEFMTEMGITSVPLKNLDKVIVHKDDSCTFVLKKQVGIKSLPFSKIKELVKDLRKAGVKVVEEL